MLVFAPIAVSAQDVYSDPYSVYNGYGPSGYGRRRNMPMTDTSKLSKSEHDKLREATLMRTVEKLKTLLNLDDLQVVVITNILSDGQKKQAVVRQKDLSEDTKAAEQLAVINSTDRQIMEYLNKDQKEKFKVLIDERNQSLKK